MKNTTALGSLVSSTADAFWNKKPKKMKSKQHKLTISSISKPKLTFPVSNILLKPEPAEINHEAREILDTYIDRVIPAYELDKMSSFVTLKDLPMVAPLAKTIALEIMKEKIAEDPNSFMTEDNPEMQNEINNVIEYSVTKILDKIG
ncbi:uncharacterized protein LOC125237079 [Leguminivora glycinivorella]|uniref:uncharacterized protein LOC125237079 n=1 Tax=Leguminivora glycinivorella TaxID=1035111 RepID=UPI0020100C02|nr:uncharacterized protein LOC125237079 [Leguminivora glycinivorella]